METSFNDFPGHEETFPVKEEDDSNKLMIKNIKYACYNPKCNLTFKSERYRDKHSFDCMENNLQPEEIALDHNAKFRDYFKENKDKIPSKNPAKPVKQKKTSEKFVDLSNTGKELTTTITSLNDFPGHEKTIPVKEEDNLNQLMINNIEYACYIPKCNLGFNSELQRDKHFFDCLKNNLQPEEIPLDLSMKFKDEFKENKMKIPSKNSMKPVKREKTSEKFVNLSNTVERRYSCSTCSRSYEYKTNLCRHITIQCGKEKKFICPICAPKIGGLITNIILKDI
ncbi:hypothetical protein KQX54_003925 [Cotesia glomerata]|uniref:C2H2-type domain-containing protein n=1 Tax=Cotesia glomerata TaxID=32391 RepID=A0AAV7IN87_COTGL|nr:hypothetical protein KQX54_003925 [Cotesia glomerata]